MSRILLSFCLILLVAMATETRAAEARADVLVYGATPGGIAAAVAAAKGGREVVLVEPTALLGGMVSSGLSYTDFRSFEALTGFFQNFAQRVETHYRKRYGDDSPQVRDSWRGTHGEPSVNRMILEGMIAEHPGIRVMKGLELAAVETTKFELGRRRIVSATFRGGAGEVKIGAAMFIDGTYEGDLLAKAGENYHVGRESRAQYGEPKAGNAAGQGDGQVQGYNFRLCMTRVAANRLVPVAPAGYKPEDFRGALPLIASGKVKRVFHEVHDGIYRIHELVNGKADVNDTPKAAVRLSMPDINDEWPEADAATRRRIFDEHLYYQVGLLYFLQNDREVPEAMRAEAREWGWCKDEFQDTGGIPPQLYVREGRRLVGQKVFTGNDTVTATRDARSKLHPDSIASADYIHNCHGTGRRGGRFDGRHEGEFYDFIQPYQIPYDVIVPLKHDNLLVPVACSASHYGFGALRLEPVWTSLGQAAGWAAHLALKDKVAVQDVGVPALQALLHKDRSATIYVTDVPTSSPDFAAVQWWGTRGGFHGLVDLEKPRPWKIIKGQYFEPFADHEAGLDRPLTPELRARWEKLLPPGVSQPANATTRGAWLRAAFQSIYRP